MRELKPLHGYSVRAEPPRPGDHWRSCPSCGARRYSILRDGRPVVYTPHTWGCDIASAVYMLRTYGHRKMRKISYGR